MEAQARLVPFSCLESYSWKKMDFREMSGTNCTSLYPILSFSSTLGDDARGARFDSLGSQIEPLHQIDPFKVFAIITKMLILTVLTIESLILQSGLA